MTVTILQGDCRAVLPTLTAGSVQCCVTSPPYYGLRDYGVAGQIGLELTPNKYVAEMVAVFREVRRALRDNGTLWLNIGDSYARDVKKGQHGSGQSGPKNTAHRAGSGRAVGLIQRLSQTHKHYGAHMAHCGIGEWEGSCKYGDDVECPALAGVYEDYKPKDLIGIPYLLAFALRASGWYWRDLIIWAKPNGMPGSQTDRCTSSHESVLFLSKSEHYFSDFDAIKTPPRELSLVRLAQDVQAQAGSHRATVGAKTNGAMKALGAKVDKQRGHSRRHAGFNDRWDAMEKAKQSAAPAMMRNVWFVSPGGYDEAHFAVMPEEIARRCILAGSREGDTVLDPFGGAGTTGIVADRLRRNATLIELNADYGAMAERRISGDSPLFADVTRSLRRNALNSPVQAGAAFCAPTTPPRR